MRHKRSYVARGVRATAALATRIARAARGGDVIALSGPLGAGKTTFVQAFAKALGVRHHLTSPTFVLMRVYKVKCQMSRRRHQLRRGFVGQEGFGGQANVKCLVHVDAYRVQDAGELVDIGLLDYLGRPDTVTLVEWAEKVKAILPKTGVWRIQIRFGERPQERIFVIAT